MWKKLQITIKHKLDKNKKIFLAELIGTFLVIVFAIGSVVLDSKYNGILGLPFIAFAPAVAVAIGIYLFGKTSMAHFNPAVTVGFLITNHLPRQRNLLLIYLVAEILGAILGSFFVFSFIGSNANLGVNTPNYANYPVPVIVGIEILASSLLMLMVLIVVNTKRLHNVGGLLIGAIIGMDVFLFGLISGASMNPARSLGPAIVSGHYTNIWLYLSAPFIGTSIVALSFSKIVGMLNRKKKDGKGN